MPRNRVLTRFTLLASLSLAILAACSDRAREITVPEGGTRKAISPVDPYDPTEPSEPSYSSGACTFTVSEPFDKRMTVSFRLNVFASRSGCSASDTIVWTASPTGLVTLKNTINGVEIFAKQAGMVTITARIGATSKGFAMNILNARVELYPATATILVNGTQQFSVRAYDHTGWEIGSLAPDRVWAVSSSNSAVASLNTSNLVVTGKSAGTARIVASLAGGADTTTVTVVADPVATVTVSPNPSTVAVGQTVQLTATLRSGNGTVLTGRPVTWTSDAPSIATVSSSGVVTGVSAGSTTIRATAEGKLGSSALTVSPPPPLPTTCNDCHVPWVPGSLPEF